jgi:hypothetical protein
MLNHTPLTICQLDSGPRKLECYIQTTQRTDYGLAIHSPLELTDVTVKLRIQYSSLAILISVKQSLLSQVSHVKLSIHVIPQLFYSVGVDPPPHSTSHPPFITNRPTSNFFFLGCVILSPTFAIATVSRRERAAGRVTCKQVLFLCS